MNKPPLFLLILLVFNCCKELVQKNADNATQHHSRPVFTYDPDLTIDNSDSLFFSHTEYGRPISNNSIADSTNSFISISGDTLKLHLTSRHGWEDSYESNFFILSDTLYSTLNFHTDFNSFENYTPSACTIRANKHNYQPGEYLTIQIHYETVGKTENAYTPKGLDKYSYDSVTMHGKIRLKIRNADFTADDLFYEKNSNEFYALLGHRPDTISKLFLQYCAFTDLPKEITHFVNLRELSLRGNELNGADLSALKHLKKLKSLDLRNCDLQRLPKSVSDLHQLEFLDISDNAMSELPEELYNLSSLKELNLYGTNISYLSPRIGNLKNLETLLTTATKIKVYPKEMIRLKKLKSLRGNDTMEYIPRQLLTLVQELDTVYHK